MSRFTLDSLLENIGLFPKSQININLPQTILWDKLIGEIPETESSFWGKVPAYNLSIRAKTTDKVCLIRKIGNRGQNRIILEMNCISTTNHNTQLEIRARAQYGVLIWIYTILILLFLGPLFMFGTIKNAGLVLVIGGVSYAFFRYLIHKALNEFTLLLQSL